MVPRLRLSTLRCCCVHLWRYRCGSRCGIPNEFTVKVNHRYGDIIAKHAHNFLGQRQQMRDFRVLNAVLGAAQCIANQMRCNVGVQRLNRQTDSEIGKTIIESANAKKICVNVKFVLRSTQL